MAAGSAGGAAVGPRRRSGGRALLVGPAVGRASGVVPGAPMERRLASLAQRWLAAPGERPVWASSPQPAKASGAGALTGRRRKGMSYVTRAP